MNKGFLEVFRGVRRLFGDSIIALKQSTQEIDVSSVEGPELADNVFILRELEKYTEDLLKEIRKVYRISQKMACLHCIMHKKDTLYGEHASGKPKISKMFKLPAKRRNDPEAFDKVMQDLGVPEDVMLAELLRPHWPTLQEFYNDRLAQGRNAPISMDDTEQVYEFKVRTTKKEIE